MKIRKNRVDAGGARGITRCVKFGVCSSIETGAAFREAGWDFLEGNVQQLFGSELESVDREQDAQIREPLLPLLAANCLVPGSLKITGPRTDRTRLEKYIRRIFKQAGRAGIQVLVFGSGAARAVPEGFDREEARRQIVDFLRMIAPMADSADITIVIEPLHRGECNIINSVQEAMSYVDEVRSPRVQCLVDSYHFWMEGEQLENLRDAMPHIRHVHVADKEGRLPPGESGAADYRPFFEVLKEGGYDGLISVEAKGVEPGAAMDRALARLRDDWGGRTCRGL